AVEQIGEGIATTERAPRKQPRERHVEGRKKRLDVGRSAERSGAWIGVGGKDPVAQGCERVALVVVEEDRGGSEMADAAGDAAGGGLEREGESGQDPPEYRHELAPTEAQRHRSAPRAQHPWWPPILSRRGEAGVVVLRREL